MPDWSEEIRARLAGVHVEPAREASVVEEIASTSTTDTRSSSRPAPPRTTRAGPSWRSSPAPDSPPA